MAIIMTCTTTRRRHSLAGSLVFSAAWMASFLVSVTEWRNHGRDHKTGGGYSGYGNARWTSEKIAHGCIYLGSRFSGAGCEEPKLQGPDNGGDSFAEFHVSIWFDGR